MTTAAARAPTRRLWPLLPPLATGVFLLAVGAVIAASGETFGFDFRAYHRAAERVLAGERLYDTTVVETGGFGLFYYPPPFVLPLLPLGVIDGSIATLVWLAAQLVAFAAAIAIMPVGRNVRWGVVLLAGLMWPVAYSFKLGQVGPLLMLLFAVGWRSMGDPVRLGASVAGGALIKLQPGLILVWAALTGRWGAVAVGVAVGLAASALATLVVGVGARSDYAQLLSRVGDPIRTPHNFTPGAIAYQLGAPAAAAGGVQIVSAVMSSWPCSWPYGRQRPKRRSSWPWSPASCCHRCCGITMRSCRSPGCSSDATGGPRSYRWPSPSWPCRSPRRRRTHSCLRLCSGPCW